jgi:preprotein translocase subunit YajC
MLWILAQEAGAAPAQQPPQGSPLPLIVFMLLVLAVWWFLVLRPQSKAAKAQRAKLDAIQKGDRVRTRGGIEGIVARVQDDKVIVKIDVEGKVHVPFAKGYIEDVLSEEPAAETKEAK